MRFRSIARSLSTSLLMVFGLSLFAFTPVSLAANPLIQNVTLGLNPFHINVPNQNAVTYIDYDYNTGGYATGPVLEQIRDSEDNVVYEFGNIGTDDKATGSYQLTWDGTYKNGGSDDGEYVPDGTYTLYLYSETPTPPAAEYQVGFAVENTVAPEVALVSEPSSAYYTQSGDYDVNYSLALNSASTSIVRLTIEGPLNNNPQQSVQASVQNTDGNYVISWNGAAATPGDYTYLLQAEGSVDGFGVLSNEIEGEFTVVDAQNPQPTITNLNVSPDPFDPSEGSVTLSYELEGSVGNTTVYAEVYNSSDPSSPLEEWTFTGQGNGSNSVTWNGDNADDGSYVFKVWGMDGNFDIVSQQKSFTVAASEEEEQTGLCAGYSDVSASDADCDAIEYVQSIGAMTGNPDGTFEPNEILQRDQVAKISLETFGLFDDSADYCDGSAAFPDVPSSQWSYQYICRGVDLDMITGYEAGEDAGFYRPARSVNRVEFLALILRNLSDSMPSNNSASYSDVPVGQWYTGYAKYSYDHSLFVGNNLQPTKLVTRREVAKVLYELYNEGKI